MHLDRYDEAIALLANWKTSSSWMNYARFNLGVALVRSNRLAEARPSLDAVGRLQSTNDELLALKDKANLALGFAYLQNQQPARPSRSWSACASMARSPRARCWALGWADAAQTAITKQR